MGSWAWTSRGCRRCSTGPEAPRALRRFIDAFYDRVERDDLLTAFFPGGVTEEHRDHVAAWWARCWGADDLHRPARRLRGMFAHHRDLGITPEQRHRFASPMSLAADDAGLPDDPEFRAAIIGYVEWGTRLAMHNSQPDAEASPSTHRCRAGAGESLRRTTARPRPPNCQLCTSMSAYRSGVRTARAASGSGARSSAAVPSQVAPSSDSSGP